MKKYLMILFVLCGLASFGQDNLYITLVGNNFGNPIKGMGISVHEAGGKNYHGITDVDGRVSFKISVFHHFNVYVENPTLWYTKPIVDLMMPSNQFLFITVTILGDYRFSQNQREEIEEVWESYFILPKKIYVEMD